MNQHLEAAPLRFKHIVTPHSTSWYSLYQRTVRHTITIVDADKSVIGAYVSTFLRLSPSNAQP